LTDQCTKIGDARLYSHECEGHPRVVAIVQARMGSTRLPGKVMKTIMGVPMIELLLKRLSYSHKIDQIVVATSADPMNSSLAEHVQTLGYRVFRGSENDVLDRYYQSAKSLELPPDVLVRVTGDCPLIDASVVDSVIEHFERAGVHYASNINPPTYPDGMDVEVFSYKALELAANQATATFDREHVTPYLRNSGHFHQVNVSDVEDFSGERWTVDDADDFQVVSRVFEYFYPRVDFSWRQVIKLAKESPDLFASNKKTLRNAGALSGTGQKLWQRAKRIIPGGNMLLSKRAEMFLPEKWPAYFSTAKGCTVWDLDGKAFTDMSIMGIGTNILGYGNDEVDEAVIRTVRNGNMSTLNCPEEVRLAEKLVELHSWADMVRLARSGGEANAIAIRIARAASGKDKVAICGYHGWHDWYLAANLGDDENLSGHLLPGLDPRGVPRNLQGTVFPFKYNKFEELETLVTANDIGAIKMEVCRNEGPEDGFLQKVRNLASDKGIVLIFDECTSGFRETFGGLHKKYGVEPDLAMFGKALGNGYAITAIIGRRAVMEAAQSTFISSTFWTERIGPTAAIATLDVMERFRSWETITETGLKIRERWQDLADKYGLTINHWGLPALTGFTFESANALTYKTLITQEMLKNSFLATNCVYTCLAHTDEVLNDYFDCLEPVFALVRECEDGRDVASLLEGPICHSGFKRLN
jgi:glutamate-1-semialdehyde 2,1-aminomutase